MIRRTVTFELVYDPEFDDSIEQFLAYNDRDVIDMGTVIHSEVEGVSNEDENSDR